MNALIRQAAGQRSGVAPPGQRLPDIPEAPPPGETESQPYGEAVEDNTAINDLIRRAAGRGRVVAGAGVISANNAPAIASASNAPDPSLDPATFATAVPPSHGSVVPLDWGAGQRSAQVSDERDFMNRVLRNAGQQQRRRRAGLFGEGY